MITMMATTAKLASVASTSSTGSNRILSMFSFSLLMLTSVDNLGIDWLWGLLFKRLIFLQDCHSKQVPDGKEGSHWLIENSTVFSSMCSPPL